MDNMIELAIIGTNVLVVLASLLLAVVTLKDVVKDSNRTILAAIKELVPVVNNRSARRRKGAPEQEQLELVDPESERKVA